MWHTSIHTTRNGWCRQFIPGTHKASIYDLSRARMKLAWKIVHFKIENNLAYTFFHVGGLEITGDRTIVLIFLFALSHLFLYY